MAELDYTINHLIMKKSYFADLINGGIFHGKQVLKAEELELMPDKSGLLYVDSKGKKRTLHRYRDVVMKAPFGTYFVVMACETQREEHYAVPVRTMIYDALNYMEQLQELETVHKDKGELKDSKEFLSGITKEDRIVPVISVVLYLGDDWDGNRCLYDMMGIDEQQTQTEDMEMLRNYIPDYHINLIQANQIEHVEKFKTDLQYIFGMLKYNTEKTLLYDYVKKNREALNHMDADAMMAMWSLLGEQKRLQKLIGGEEGKEKKDMCKAIDELIADGEAAGEAKGERRLSELILLLTRQKRQDLIVKAASDEKLRKKLYEKYHL